VTTLIVIAKQPIAGKVKTRLVPPLTHEQAAMVAGAALRDTLDAVGRADADHCILAFDGDPRGWRPRGWRHVRQVSGGLAQRMVAAFETVDRGPAVLVGMDTPQLQAQHVDAFDPARFDACFGPATDGGYWAIGFADPAHAAGAIRGVPMSTDRTGAVQLDRLHALGLRVQILAELADVDTIDTACDVARLAPETAFAATLAATQPPTLAATWSAARVGV
jgi:uncharacterized protein